MSDAPESLSLRTETRGKATVLRISGEVDLHRSPELRAALMTLLERRPPRLVLDLGEVPYMDSSGVGTLVELKRNVDKYRGQLVLAALAPRVRSVFEIAQLTRFFTISATVDEALRA